MISELMLKYAKRSAGVALKSESEESKWEDSRKEEIPVEEIFMNIIQINISTV